MTIEELKKLSEELRYLMKSDLEEVLYNAFKKIKFDTEEIDLSYLDFSRFRCDVNISHLTVDGCLNQQGQKVHGDLKQDNSICLEGSIYQSSQYSKGNIHQSYSIANGFIFQNNNKGLSTEEEN